VTGFFEHSNIPSGSINGGNLLNSRVTINFSRIRAMPHGVSQSVSQLIFL
jgi:hypothetical protein